MSRGDSKWRADNATVPSAVGRWIKTRGYVEDKQEFDAEEGSKSIKCLFQRTLCRRYV